MSLFTKPLKAATNTVQVSWKDDDDDDDDDFSMISHDLAPQAPQVIRCNGDILAALLKYNDDPTYAGYSGPFTEALVNNPLTLVPEDLDQGYIQQAENIRNYYKHKIMHLGLTGQEISEFRQTVYTIVCNPTEVKQDHIGALCSLPRFFQEDVEVDFITSQAKGANPSIVFSSASINDEFEALGSTRRRTKRWSEVRYWFRRSNGELAVIIVEGKSAANPALELMFTKGKRFRIACLPGVFQVLGSADPTYALKIHGQYVIKECA